VVKSNRQPIIGVANPPRSRPFYNHSALRDVDFVLVRGTISAMLGANGAGKPAA
jgi:ABC-type sugar transport system ATPase subunit